MCVTWNATCHRISIIHFSCPHFEWKSQSLFDLFVHFILPRGGDGVTYSIWTQRWMRISICFNFVIECVIYFPFFTFCHLFHFDCLHGPNFDMQFRAENEKKTELIFFMCASVIHRNNLNNRRLITSTSHNEKGKFIWTGWTW